MEAIVLKQPRLFSRRQKRSVRQHTTSISIASRQGSWYDDFPNFDRLSADTEIPETRIVHGDFFAVCWFHEIKYGGRRFEFRRPLLVRETQQKDGCTYECPELDICAYGRTEDEALGAFAMEFSATWDAIASEHDQFLTVDAQKLKLAIRRLVKRVSGQLIQS